ESWRRAAPRQGFVVSAENGTQQILGRLCGGEFELSFDRGRGTYQFTDRVVVLEISDGGDVVSARWASTSQGERLLDMSIYHTLKHLLHGVLDKTRVNQRNSAY